MKSTSRLSLMLLCVVVALLGVTVLDVNTLAAEAKRAAGDKPFFEIWDEEMIYCSMVVAMDGSVLLFEPVRFEDKLGYTIVKRSEDGGKTWGSEIEVGRPVKIKEDMSDGGRYKGPQIGWTELGNTIVDENTGDIMVFATSLKAGQILYRGKDHGKTWMPSAPFPLGGTGEAGPSELSDGWICFNSRTHMRGGNRRITFSDDNSEQFPFFGGNKNGKIDKNLVRCVDRVYCFCFCREQQRRRWGGQNTGATPERISATQVRYVHPFRRGDRS